MTDEEMERLLLQIIYLLGDIKALMGSAHAALDLCLIAVSNRGVVV